MYRTGHYGVALLSYAPVGLLVSVAGHETAAVVGGALVVGLSTVPDYDLYLPLIRHRGPTHTVAFAFLVGAALAGGAAAFVGASSSFADVGFVAFAFAVGAVAVGSHVLADALTPAGVRPFWPVSSRRYSFAIARASSPVANYALFALGVAAVVVAVGVALV